MRKYYLFIIKNEYIIKNKSYGIFKMLKKIYYLKSYDFSYGINIYRELCLPFSVNLLNNYLDKRISHKKINNKLIKIQDENTYLQLMYPCVIIKTNQNIPKILKIFHIYNRNIFICDFDNDDYFWLNDYFNSTLKKINI